MLVKFCVVTSLVSGTMVPVASELFFALHNAIAQDVNIQKEIISRKRRRWWMRMVKLIPELRNEDPNIYKNYIRMNEEWIIFFIE